MTTYPLSTSNGQAIPLEVVQPRGFLFCAFNTAAVTSVLLPATYPLVAVSATEDCYICAHSNCAHPKPNAGQFQEHVFFIDRRKETVLHMPHNQFRVVGDTKAGALRLQFLELWRGLGTVLQRR